MARSEPDEYDLSAGVAYALPMLMENTSEAQNMAGIILCMLRPFMERVLAAAIMQPSIYYA